MQLALMFAASVRPDMVQGISQDIMKTMGPGGKMGAAAPQPMQADHINGLNPNEPAQVANARERSGQASQPAGGRVTKQKEDKR